MKSLRTIIFISTLTFLSATSFTSAITWTQAASVANVNGDCNGTVNTDKDTYSVGDTMSLTYDITAHVGSGFRPIPTGTVTCDATAVSNSNAISDFTYDYVGAYPDLLSLPIQSSSVAAIPSGGGSGSNKTVRLITTNNLTVPSLSNGSHYISYAFYINTEDATANLVSESWALDTLSFLVAPVTTVKVCFGGAPCP